MKTSAQAALWGAFCADAYALGAHWVYETDKIEAGDFDWEHYNAPIMHYHHPKNAGDLTHYGDQMGWLLGLVARTYDFDCDAFSRLWYEKMQGYEGYVDSASRQLIHMIESKGDREGTSADLAGAASFAPLLYRYRENIRFLLEAVEGLSGLTHANDEVTRAALYFAEVGFHLIQDRPMEATLRGVAAEYCHRIKDQVQAGIDSRFRPSYEAVEYFGKSCGIGSLGGVIHLLMKYENDFRGAMEANVRAGGDSAARGLIVGTLLGAHLGMEAIPSGWPEALHLYGFITAQMEAIDDCCEREDCI